MATPDGKPRVFISYCWENPETVRRVHEFADFLDHNGIHLEMDRYLPEGASLYKFMESMVNDPGVDRVLCFIDRAYTRREQEGEGGVSVETTIISQDVYDQVSKTGRPVRFIPVLLEKPGEGERAVPVMFATAKQVWMTDAATDDQNKVRLLNLCAGQPEYTRSQSAKLPAHLRPGSVAFDSRASGLATLVQTQVQQDRPQRALVSFQDYLDALADAFERFNLDVDAGHYHHNRTQQISELVDERAAVMTEYAETLDAVLRSGDSAPVDDLLDFFARLLRLNFSHRASLVTKDVSRVFTREFFTVAVALLIRRRLYTDVPVLLTHRYPGSGFKAGYDRLCYGPEDMGHGHVAEAWQQGVSRRLWERAGLSLPEAVQAEVVLVLFEGSTQDGFGWGLDNAALWRGVELPLFARAESPRTLRPLSEIFGSPIVSLLPRWEMRKDSPERMVTWSNLLKLRDLRELVESEVDRAHRGAHPE